MFEAFLAVAEGKPLSAVSEANAPADAGGEDGFEVDFVEAQTTVVQPEPVAHVPPVEVAPPTAASAAAPDAPPEAPVVPSALDASPEGSVAASTATPEVAPSTAAEPATQAPPPVASAPSVEVPFWSEVAAASAPAASTPPVAETLWSDEEEEVEADEVVTSPTESEPVAPVLSLAQPAPDEPPPLARPLPVVPRIGVPALTVTPAARPGVPAIGLWGPGARRTGAHAAVAVVLPESPSSVAPLPTPPAAPSELHEAVPPPAAVRPLPTPAPLGAVARPDAAPPVPAPVSLRPVEPSPPPAGPAAAEERGHQGGVWSPGAALAELVSEMRAEDAQRMAAVETDAAPAASAAQAVTEQRASRERLALMSATEEPTVPVPSVSGRPRKVPLSPAPARPAPRGPKFWELRLVQYAGAAVAVFLVGVLAAVLLLKVH